MQATEATPSSDHSDSASSPDDVGQALRELSRTAHGKPGFYRRSVELLARHFDAPAAAVAIDSSTGAFTERVNVTQEPDAWRSISDAMMLDALYRRLPMAKLFKSAQELTLAALAAPITEESANEAVGSLFLVVRTQDKATAAASLAELTALTNLIGLLAHGIGSSRKARPSSANSQSNWASAASGAAKAAAHSSFDEFAFALTNGIKSKIGCEQVSLGLVAKRRVKIVCISGLDDLYPRSPGSRLICQAMEECLDANRPIGFRGQDGGDGSFSTGHLLHQRWHQQTHGSAVASLPLIVEDRCVAVLSLRGDASTQFTAKSLEEVSKVVTPLIPGLLLQRHANRGFVRHFAESSAESAGRWLGRGAWGRKILLVTFLLSVVWMIFGRMDHTLTVPCQVVPDEVRHLSAPFDGVLLRTYVQPGDNVKAGDLLLEFDVRDLVLERDRIQSQLRIAMLELNEAIAAKDHLASAQTAARVELAQGELDLVAQRIARAKVVAPSDGTILAGEVRERVGEVIPIGTPMMEFARHDQWAVELQVPQHLVSYFAVGQRGKFATAVRPDEFSSCEVSRIPISSRVADGKHVFLAWASLGERPSWIRPGTTGIAKIQAGRRSAGWVMVHRIGNTLRTNIWGAF